MFSIADLQSEDDIEAAEGEEEGEEAGEDAPYHAFPVRASLSITKVRYYHCLLVVVIAHAMMV
jgi:hypothetical protein